MKKYSLGLLTVLLAVSLAAFTNIKAPEKKLTDLYWFNVPGNIANGSNLTNAQVSYLNAHQPGDPNPGACSSGTKYCHVGFRDDQVTGSGSNIMVSGSQQPASFDSKP